MKVREQRVALKREEIDKCVEEGPRVVRIICQSSLVYLPLVLMKASFLWAAAVTFEWQKQERGLATRMTIEGRKHASLADVKDIFLFFGQRKIEGFLLALEFCPFQQKSEGREKRLTKKSDEKEKIQWSAEMEEGGILLQVFSALNWPRQILGDNQNNHKETQPSKQVIGSRWQKTVMMIWGWRDLEKN